MTVDNIPQVPIKVYEKDNWVIKNLIDATYEQRLLFYNMQSKGQIANVLERFIEFNLKNNKNDCEVIKKDE
jgi:hypothetical protein